jgi:predicted O-methyltransferase YrrM
MIWADIHGWFYFQGVYDLAVSEFPQGVFVEVGAWLGRSTAYLASRIQGLPIKFFVVDTWRGSAGSDAKSDDFQKSVLAQNQGDVFSIFLGNMKRCGVLQSLIPLRMLSTQAAELFHDSSIEFCFLDAAHDYNSVKADLDAWFPKIRPGGIIAGDDYGVEWHGLDRAVNDFFAGLGKLMTRGRAWLFRKPD